jgi:hypothetical protein
VRLCLLSISPHPSHISIPLRSPISFPAIPLLFTLFSPPNPASDTQAGRHIQYGNNHKLKEHSTSQHHITSTPSDNHSSHLISFPPPSSSGLSPPHPLIPPQKRNQSFNHTSHPDARPPTLLPFYDLSQPISSQASNPRNETIYVSHLILSRSINHTTHDPACTASEAPSRERWEMGIFQTDQIFALPSLPCLPACLPARLPASHLARHLRPSQEISLCVL